MIYSFQQKPVPTKEPLAAVLLRGGYPREALAALLHEDIGNPTTLANMGVCWRLLGELKIAESCYRDALAKAVRHDILWNYGVLLEDLGLFHQAMQAFEGSLKLNPNSQGAAYRLVTSRWRLSAGLPGDENLWEQARIGTWYDPIPGLPPLPLSDLPTEARILVTREGGMGDLFWLLPFVQELRDAGNYVAVVPWDSQRDLVIEQGFPVPELREGIMTVDPKDFDFHLPIMSCVPRLLREPPKARKPYIQAPPPISPRAKFIGVAWSAAEAGVEFGVRSIPVEAFASLERWRVHKPVLALSLEKAPDWMVQTKLKNWRDTASALAMCELVISADTAVAHLAGAMGIPTWILLPKGSDWKWFTGLTTPWYSSALLFRNARTPKADRSEWAPFIEEVLGMEANP